MPAQPAKPRRRDGRFLLVDGRPTFIPSTLAEVGRFDFPGGPAENFPPSPRSKGPRGRGRPSKPSSGTWEDDDLLARVKTIVGSRDERDDDGAAVLADLRELATQELGRKLTPKQDQRLRKLVFGAGAKKAEKASVITRELLTWRHSLPDPAVRRMQRSLRSGARPPVKMTWR